MAATWASAHPNNRIGVEKTSTPVPAPEKPARI
jgi:hypothetical protein